jgi:hypothetical protein
MIQTSKHYAIYSVSEFPLPNLYFFEYDQPDETVSGIVANEILEAFTQKHKDADVFCSRRVNGVVTYFYIAVHAGAWDTLDSRKVLRVEDV